LVALDNLIDFVALCADRARSPEAANQVFHVADRCAVSTPELLRRVAAAAGERVFLISIPETWLKRVARVLGRAEIADRLVGSLVVDASKAGRLLGWYPPTTLDEQLKKMMSRETDS
jgi:nucleoside-diphosphate-sugar epimerase